MSIKTKKILSLYNTKNFILEKLFKFTTKCPFMIISYFLTKNFLFLLIF